MEAGALAESRKERGEVTPESQLSRMYQVSFIMVWRKLRGRQAERARQGISGRPHAFHFLAVFHTTSASSPLSSGYETLVMARGRVYLLKEQTCS